MVSFKLSEGAVWLIERLPEAAFKSLKEDLEAVIEHELEVRGYGKELREAFNEQKPLVMERDNG